MKSLHTAVKAYYTNNGGVWPNSLEELITPPDGGKPLLDGGPSAILDPWGKPYQLTMGANEEPYLFTTSDKGQPIQWPRQ
jgi:hypothetical protein